MRNRGFTGPRTGRSAVACPMSVTSLPGRSCARRHSDRAERRRRRARHREADRSAPTLEPPVNCSGSITRPRSCSCRAAAGSRTVRCRRRPIPTPGSRRPDSLIGLPWKMRNLYAGDDGRRDPCGPRCAPVSTRRATTLTSCTCDSPSEKNTMPVIVPCVAAKPAAAALRIELRDPRDVVDGQRALLVASTRNGNIVGRPARSSAPQTPVAHSTLICEWSRPEKWPNS